MDLTMHMDDSARTTDAPKKVVAPPHRVPPEIVVEIIHKLLPEKIDCNIQMHLRLDVLLSVTGIDRYWRYAALDHATLWSVVPMERRNLGELFLQRSQNVPLFVRYETKARQQYQAHQAMVSLLPHIHRVENVHLRAPVAVLNEVFSTFNRFMRGAQLKEISVHPDESIRDEWRKFDLNLLLEHASTLKVLRAGVLGSLFPGPQLQVLSGLTYLEVLTSHDVRDVLSLLTSLPALTSTKVHVGATRPPTDKHRTVLPANLRHIHLRIDSHAVYRVLDALQIPTGVHFECEVFMVLLRPMIDDPTRHLILPSEFFENTSHIEDLRISLFSCSGSGPSGSFCIEGIDMGISRLPIEDFSLLRQLVVDRTIERRFLEHIVKSALRLVSVIFCDCTVIKSRTSQTPRTPVDVDTFVKIISGGHSAGTDPEVMGVNGTLEGGRLEEFRSLCKE